MSRVVRAVGFAAVAVCAAAVGGSSDWVPTSGELFSCGRTAVDICGHTWLPPACGVTGGSLVLSAADVAPSPGKSNVPLIDPTTFAYANVAFQVGSCTTGAVVELSSAEGVTTTSVILAGDGGIAFVALHVTDRVTLRAWSDNGAYLGSWSGGPY